MTGARRICLRPIRSRTLLIGSRGDKVSAFYISNVETYLYGDKYAQFVKNVARLPREARLVSVRARRAT